jgi:hypothetical protein
VLVVCIVHLLLGINFGGKPYSCIRHTCPLTGTSVSYRNTPLNYAFVELNELSQAVEKLLSSSARADSQNHLICSYCEKLDLTVEDNPTLLLDSQYCGSVLSLNEKH